MWHKTTVIEIVVEEPASLPLGLLTEFDGSEFWNAFPKPERIRGNGAESQRDVVPVLASALGHSSSIMEGD